MCRIRSDNGTEFTNHILNSFLVSKGISHNFSGPYTPQQNGVVEQRKWTLVEAAKSMLNFANLPLYFWAEAVATSCFVQNRSVVCKRLSKTLYEGLNNRKPNVWFFHIFGCRCFLINNRDHHNKFASKSDKGIFLGYSTNKVAYRVLIRRTRLIIESFDVKFDDYYVCNIAPWTENKEILKSDIPASSGPINIVEVNYDDLFDPVETAKLSEVLVSPEAQQQHADVSGPSIQWSITQYFHLAGWGGKLHSGSSNNHRGSSTWWCNSSLYLQRISTLRCFFWLRWRKYRKHWYKNWPEGYHTSNNPGEPSQVQEELQSAIQGEPQSEENSNPTFPTQDNSAGCSQVQGELPSPTTKSSDIEDIPSTAASDHLQPRLHVWTKDHPSGQIIGNPSAGIQTRSS